LPTALVCIQKKILHTLTNGEKLVLAPFLGVPPAGGEHGGFMPP
jgi:hypothetical protein